MKCILYIPTFECANTRASNISAERVGGLTLYERACRSIQRADIEELIVAKPASLELHEDPFVTLPKQFFEYNLRIHEISQDLKEAVGYEPCMICVLDGVYSPDCFKMRPLGADVRIVANGEPSGIYFVGAHSFEKILDSEESLDSLEVEVTETFAAPDKTVYHRMLSADDAKIGLSLLIKALRKPLGRDADGLVAYAINRHCSLFITKRIANTFITANMVTAIGLLIGLAGAAFMFLGNPDNNRYFMALGVLLWQISSIVDGIDGELARLRMNPSHKGEWFDTISDDVTNIAFLIALGHAVSQSASMPFFQEMTIPYIGCNPWFIITCGVALVNTIAVIWFYREFVKMGIASHNHFEWGFETDNKTNQKEEKRNIFKRSLERVAGGFAMIAKRDSYTFMIMVLVIIGLSIPAYFIMAGGAFLVGIGGIIALSNRARKLAKKNNKEKQPAHNEAEKAGESNQKPEAADQAAEVTEQAAEASDHIAEKAEAADAAGDVASEADA
ncbi:MAG: CDP-alcohol phosphatidyltransferase family protein [Proteobacteria bacterium]|nr:CDP-alcohol phosphatidyltransferase family protein [Pseudomonadota bacterium]